MRSCFLRKPFDQELNGSLESLQSLSSLSLSLTHTFKHTLSFSPVTLTHSLSIYFSPFALTHSLCLSIYLYFSLLYLHTHTLSFFIYLSLIILISLSPSLTFINDDQNFNKNLLIENSFLLWEFHPMCVYRCV